jgi:predicted P-loop ATPase/GTPase
MSKGILVVGLQPNDAGKTTLCKALIHGFKETGVTLVPFKPHSGIGYWSQFDALQRNLANGSLLSSDIMELEGAAQSLIPLEVLNPVNRLSHPVPDTGMLEEKLAFQEFIAERFTYHDGLTHKNVYYFNGALNLSRLRDMQTFYLRIKKNAQKIHFIRKFEDLVEAYSMNFDKATSSCYAGLRNMPLIVESFNDAAYPFNHAEDCDTVLCVASNTVLQFEERRYFEAIESRGKEKPRLQLTLSHVYAPSLIKAKFIVQPLTTDERNDPAKLTQNYSEVIKKIVETAQPT